MITVYTGPMFSGKTQALMARLRSKERAHKKILVVKPELDDRFHSLDEIVGTSQAVYDVFAAAIRYVGEHVRRKAGKTAQAAAK